MSKTVVITGTSTGFGRDTAETLASAGHRVFATMRDPQGKNSHHAAALGAMGIYVIEMDVTQDKSVNQAVTHIKTRAEYIDVLINNAGITRDTLMLRMSEDQWDQVIETNLKSVFNLTKHVLRPMLKQRSGSIINMSSVVGDFGNAGQANYAASKAGIFGFTKSIAKEVGSRGIRCNALAPGFIETDMTQELDEKTKAAFLAGIPLKRLGKAEEVADACLFLGSDLSTYVSGQTISVCGALNC